MQKGKKLTKDGQEGSRKGRQIMTKYTQMYENVIRKLCIVPLKTKETTL